MNWQQAAERLRSSVEFEKVPQAVRESLEELSGPLRIACSGGADSLFALLWLVGENGRRPQPWQIEILHFNHALRGADSDGDEALARSVAECLGLGFQSARAQWGRETEAISEEEARQARLAFFESAVKHDADFPAQIVVGHQCDDIAETMLMRLSRGAGIEGLCAPRPVSRVSERIQFLRPLLGLSRSEILSSLRECGVGWREDESNQSDRFYRNRLRSLVIPQWREVADRDLSTGVARSRQLLEEDAETLRLLAGAAWSRLWRAEEPDCLARSDLSAMPLGLRRRIVQHFANERAGVNLSPEVIEQVLQRLGSSQPFSFDISPVRRLRATLDSLRIEDAEETERLVWSPVPLILGASLFLPDGCRLALQQVETNTELLKGLREGRLADDAELVYVDAGEKQSPTLWVRQRKAGDAFKPNGKSSPKKLKELLIERKIERQVRDCLPVVVRSDDRIVWVPGLPPAADTLVSEGTAYALQLTYQR